MDVSAMNGIPSPYLGHVLQRFEEVLSRIDGEFFSDTYGSGDRNYWAWKFVDFAGARFQEFLYTLAWMRSSKFADPKWQGNAILGNLLNAGFSFWGRIQYRDGSFDEAYPFERSLAATAFTLFYATEAIALSEDALSDKSGVFRIVRNSADWLCSNDETHGVLSNHLASAAAALWNAYELFGAQRYRDRSDHFLKRILDAQSEEGWYEEYGGADIGYQTHCSFYLARLWQRSGNPALLESLKRANRFLSHFVHPDGSVGGEYASRGTKFFFPAAYEMLHDECEDARAIAVFQREMIADRRGVGLWQMDEYNVYPMLNNYLFAEDAMRSSKEDPTYTGARLPWRSEQSVVFEHAGIAVRSTNDHYVVIGLGVGGVIRIWNKKEGTLRFQQAGYLKRVGKDWLTTRAPSRWTKLDDGWMITNSPVKVNQRVFSPFMFICFRLFNVTIGRFPALGRWLKRLLVRVLVSKRTTAGGEFSRQITWRDDGSLAIVDNGPGFLRGSIPLDRFLPFHMGSSRYIDQQEELRREVTDEPLACDSRETIVPLWGNS